MTIPAYTPQWANIADFLQYWFSHDPLQGTEREVFHRYYSGYRQRFTPYIRHHFAEQTRDICTEIRRIGAPQLLEIGTGCGTEALWFAILGARVTTIDLRPDRIGVARARKAWLEHELGLELDITFAEASIFDFHPDRSFDLIWMEQAYHHIEPREWLAPTLFQLTAPGGKVIISEANAWNPMLQVQLFLRRGFHTKGTFVDNAGTVHAYGDERITTPLALRRSLRRAGFDAVRSRNFRMLPNSNPPTWWLGAERALLGIAPALSSHFNVIGTRSHGPITRC